LSNEVRGYSAVIAAALFWGIGAVVAKAMFNHAVDPLFLVKMRLILSFLILFLCIFLYDKRLLIISRTDIFYFAALGTFGMALMQLSYFYTIMLTSVATAIFLQFLAPVFIASYETVWEKAHLGLKRGGAVAIAAVGGLLIMLESGSSGNIGLLGIITGLLSAVALSINTVYGRRSVRKYHPVTGVMYSFGFGALSCWLVIPGTPVFAEISAGLWAMILYITIFSTLIPFLLYFIGVRFLSPTNVGTTAYLEPVIAVVAAYLALGEVMGPFQMLGGALIIGAVVMIQTAGVYKDSGVQIRDETTKGV
jgi:drug/metabolite transporter (DMT)-like permease